MSDPDSWTNDTVQLGTKQPGIYLFIQAGPAGFDRWSGTQRALSSFADKAGQDIVLTMTLAGFKRQFSSIMSCRRHYGSFCKPL
jgi:hypothetical protein